MKIGYRPTAGKSAAPHSAQAIRIGLPLNRKPTTSDRMLTETISESDLPSFLQGDGKDTPRRVAEADWTKPFGSED